MLLPFAEFAILREAPSIQVRYAAPARDVRARIYV